MIYEWPKGSVIRVVLAIVAGVVAVDFAIYAWGGYVAWQDATQGRGMLLVTPIVYAVLALLAGLGGLIAVLVHPKSSQFLIEVQKEMAKVTWPTRPDVIRSTIVIAILTVVLALAILLVDSLNQVVVYDWILGSPRTGG
jgi:preprotein translocase subunit SecE